MPPKNIPSDPCYEFVLQEFIARSYPDNIPEFGVKYFGKITFLFNDGSERVWQGEVDWKKTEAFPSGMFFSPNLVTTDGRRYAFKKTGTNVFLWVWIDNKGNQISPWSLLTEIPQGYGMSYPGYYFIDRSVFSGYVELKKSEHRRVNFVFFYFHQM